MYDIIVLVDGSKRSKRVREELINRGYVIHEVESVQDWEEDLKSAYGQATTPLFYVVDSHYHIYESFKFDYVVPEWDKTFIHLFSADGTEEAKEKATGYGGIRLFPRSAFDGNRIPGYVHDKYGAGGIKHINIPCGCYLSSRNLNIFFLSTDELNQDENFQQLLLHHPTATHVQASGNIYESHKNIADSSYTQLFAVVDADCWLEKPFLKIDDKINYSYVNVWQVRNPINGLVYGHGGPKLLSRHLFKKGPSAVDMTFSLTKPEFVRVLPEVVGEHRFNWSAFSTWRTAFREVVKLSSAKDDISKARVEAWLSRASKKEPFWKYCLAGAKAGSDYVANNSGDLNMINDYKQLKSLMGKYI